MTVSETVDRILASLTSERLREIILDLSAAQAADTRSAVSVPDVAAVVAGGADLGVGADEWAAQMRLKRAIKELVGGLAGMRYVEGDS
ncbi:MAG: hypothetical protein V1772_10385 [Chloroflexota bacterium]